MDFTPIPNPRPSSLVPASLAAVLDWHMRRYPLLQAQDIYKLVYQGVFGPGHIIASADFARRALEDELAALEVQSPMSKVRSQNESEFEPIDPSGVLLRVNLRPLAGQAGAVEWLATALIESARRVKGNREQMGRRLSAAVRRCRKNLPRQATELERIAVEALEAGCPAFHHSPAYRRAYQPAYRVILRTCLKRRRVSGTAG